MERKRERKGKRKKLTGANDDGLGVREDGGDCEAAGALDVHEEGAGRRDERLSNKTITCQPFLFLFSWCVGTWC